MLFNLSIHYKALAMNKSILFEERSQDCVDVI